MGGAAATIVALATPALPAARAVIRISGPRAFEMLRAVFACSPSDAAIPGADPPRWRATFGRLTLDAALWPEIPAAAWVFAAPKSATGEDLVELHLPGALALTDAVLDRLCADGARIALPGEFTRRAFQNGRLTLSGVESVAALIEAEGEAQRRIALRTLRDQRRDRIDAVKADLTDLRALIELGIDFAEEEVSLLAPTDYRSRIARAQATLDEAAAHWARVGFDGALPRVALCGPPNVGKSTLFNALAPDAAHLVSEHAGTTRDHLEQKVVFGDQRVILVDTPGLTQSDGKSAVSRDFDLVVAMREASRLPRILPDGDLWVAAKADMPAAGAKVDAPWLALSARTGQGVADLQGRIAAQVEGIARPDGGLAHTRACLQRAGDALREARGLDPVAAAELAAAVLQRALRELGALTGEVSPDEWLERLFSRFCIGK